MHAHRHKPAPPIHTLHTRTPEGLNKTFPAAPSSANNGGSRVGFGDPSFIGIARPADLNDPNLTATWVKDPTAPITFLNESGGAAAGYSGYYMTNYDTTLRYYTTPSALWKL